MNDKEYIDQYLPSKCPACETVLNIDMPHLRCPNENCVGKKAKKLASAAGLLDLRGIGGKRLEPFAKDFDNMLELMIWVLQKGESSDISNYDIEPNSRLHEIFVAAFKNIKTLPYEKVIQMIGYENVGKTLSLKLAKEYAGLDVDYGGLEKALVRKMQQPEIVFHIIDSVRILENLGIKIERPQLPKADSFGVCMTGKTKAFGFKTKKEFLSQFEGVNEVKLSDPICKYLITDSYDSTSNKMTDAKKKGIEIVTYGDFKI